MIKATCILLALISLALTNANGQDIKILNEIQVGTKKTRDALLQNVKIKGTRKYYDTMPIGKFLGTGAFDVVADGSAILLKESTATSQSGIFITADELYSIGATAKDKYQINWHSFAWKENSSNRTMRYPYHLINMTSVSNPGSTHAGTANDYYPDKEHHYPIREIVFDELDGKKVYRITQEWKNQDGITPIISYVDATNFLVLREVTKRTLDYKLRKMVDVEQVTDYTYTPNPGGIPFPKSVKGWYVEANGKKLPMTDIEYTEYKRYTPTPDEVDMEKQFGISPLPLPPRPELPAAARGATPGTKIARWLYGSAALFAILTATIVVRARRRARIGV